MDLKLRDKLALVTGSTKGIGLAIATALAIEGARVIVNGRSEQSVSTALAEILERVPKATLQGFPGDLATAAAAAQLATRFPAVDILVNNLGIFEPKPFEEIADEDWQRFFDVNVLSGIRLSRAYLPGMKQRNWGRVVFISSESAIQIPAEMIHYGMTKTAQLAVSRGMAETCAGTGVTVNAVLPGPTKSAGVDEFVAQLSGGRPFAEFEKEFFQFVRPTSLLKRFATTDEVSSLVAYVCSPLASATNGTALRVDGGVVRTCF
jgi:NAD(P)-dependent dehydrogenase (short-subunit alcohol dehydrogenase family)